MKGIGTKFRLITVAAVGAGLCLPGGLAAQNCRGIPLVDTPLAITGERGLGVEGGSRWGGQASYRVGGAVALSAGYARTGYDDPVSSATTSLGSSVAYQRTVAGESDGARLSVCPVAGLHWERYGQLDLLAVPVGLAVGITVPLSRGWRALLHVEPRAVYTQGEVAGLSDSTLSPGVRGGATIEYGRIFIGATQGWVRGRSNHRIAIHAGVGIGGGGER